MYRSTAYDPSSGSFMSCGVAPARLLAASMKHRPCKNDPSGTSTSQGGGPHGAGVVAGGRARMERVGVPSGGGSVGGGLSLPCDRVCRLHGDRRLFPRDLFL